MHSPFFFFSAGEIFVPYRLSQTPKKSSKKRPLPVAGALNFCELLFFGNLVLLFGEDGVGQDAQDQSAGNGPDFHSAEGDSHTADTHDEDDAGGEEVAVLVQVNLLEHLEAGGGDEAVESDADAAHDAGRNSLEEGDKRSYHGEDDAGESRAPDRDGGSVAGDGDTGDGFSS